MSISFGLWIIRATRNEHKPIHVARLEKLNWFDVNLEQQRPWKIQDVPKIRSSTLQVCSVTYDCTHETNHLCKSCLFLIKYHIFFALSFYWEIQFLHFSAKGMHTRLYFPAKYLSYFVSWIAHNLSSVLWISWKMHPVNAKKLSIYT